MAFAARTKATVGNRYGLIGDQNQSVDNDDAYAAHDHLETNGESALGTDSVGQAQIAASAVGQGELKTTASETSNADGSGTTVNVSSQYAFMPLVKETASPGGSAAVYFQDKSFYGRNQSTTVWSPGTTYYHQLFLRGNATNWTAYLYYRYVASCPPYDLDGDEPWYWFLWLLRDKSTGAIHSAHCADDPPWHFGHDDLPKNDLERLIRTPHPWTIDFPDPSNLVAAGLEIVLLDLRDLNDEIAVDPLEAHQLDRLVVRRDARLAAGIPLDIVDAAEEKARTALEAARLVAVDKTTRLAAQAENTAIANQSARIRALAEQRFAEGKGDMAAAALAAKVVTMTTERAAQATARAAALRNQLTAAPFGRIRAIHGARARADRLNRGLLELVHGEVEAATHAEQRIAKAATATREIVKGLRDKLPTIPIGETKTPWRDVVHVLRVD